MKKRVLSILLTVCMLLSVVPMMGITASATFTAAESYVCYIDANKNGIFDGSDVKYKTIAEAITAAGEVATTIRMIDNVTENVKIGSSTDRTKNITLDLNGKTLSSTGTVESIRHNAITNFATLTVTDTSTSGSGKITGGTGAAVGKGSYGGGVYNSAGFFTMLGGTITGNYAGLGGGVANMYAAGTFTMLGGTITGNTAGTKGGGVFNNGTIIIGGTAKIENNTIVNTTTASNLYLDGNQATIATGDNALKPEATIGVTTATVPTAEAPVRFTVNGENTDTKCFFSDNDAYGVKYNESGYLELVIVPEAVKDANYAASLTLGKNIDVNFKMSNIPNVDKDNLSITVDGTPVSFELEDGVATCVLKAVKPKDIGTPLHIVVTYEGVTVKDCNYSVVNYCNAVYNHKNYGADSELGRLCTALLNYGKYAEDYAKGNTASTINAGHELDLSKITLPTSKKKFTPSTTYGDIGSEAYLKLESTVKLNYYVKSSFAYNNSDAKTQNFFILNENKEQIDPAKVDVAKTTGGYIISIDLYAYQLANEYTLKVKDVDLKDFEITFGVYDYCTEVQNMSGKEYTDTLKTLCKAIYNYSEAVKAYAAQ